MSNIRYKRNFYLKRTNKISLIRVIVIFLKKIETFINNSQSWILKVTKPHYDIMDKKRKIKKR